MNDNFEEMDRYFEGQMSNAEKAAFEQRCNADENLAEEVALYITIHDHLKQEWITKRKRELEGYEEEQENAGKDNSFLDDNPESNVAFENKQYEYMIPAVETSRAKRRNLFYPVAAAAAVLACIVLTITWNKEYQNKPTQVAVAKKDTPALLPGDTAPSIARRTPPTDQIVRYAPPDKPLPTEPKKTPSKTHALFAKNFTPEPPPLQAPVKLKEALALYEQENYSAAIKSLDKVQNEQLRGGEMTDEEELTSFYISFYKAQIHMERGNAGNAIVELTSALAKSPADGYTVAAKWYLALAYLLQENLVKAKALLREVAANGSAGVYRTKATQLLEQL